MNSPMIICILAFVGFSVLQCTVARSGVHHKSPDVPSVPENESIFVVSQGSALEDMFDVNDDIRNFVSVECDKLKFSMAQITNLGRSMYFLALDDNEILQLQQLHEYLIRTNEMCDDLRNQMLHFADERYDQYIAGIPYKLSSDQIYRLGSPSRLEWAVAVTEDNFSLIKSIFMKNETKTAVELAELKKLKISAEIIKLTASVKEIQLGIEPLMSVTKIKNDFLKNIHEMASDLQKHVEEVLNLDDLKEIVAKCIEAIVNAQKGVSMELAFAFLV